MRRPVKRIRTPVCWSCHRQLDNRLPEECAALPYPDALPHARELLRLEEASSAADLTTLFIVGQCLRDAGAIDEARAVLERFLVAFGEDGNPTIRDEVRGWLASLRTPPS